MDQYQEPISITDILGVINEAMVYSDPQRNISINVYPDGDRSYGAYTAYFKLYSSQSVTTAPKVARITILDPTYVTHRDSRTPWVLSSSERKCLNKIMHSKPTGKFSKYPSVWSAVAGEFASIYRLKTGITIDFGTNIPDFTTIKPDLAGKPKSR